MGLELWTPRAPEELYLERAGDDEESPGHTDLLLPIFQGDVFDAVALPAIDEISGPGAMVMMVAHPCSILGGEAQYLPRLPVVRVRSSDALGLEEWPRRAYETQPLPGLLRNSPATHFSAFFHEQGLVPIEQLDPSKRIATLTLEGVVGLQQRLIHESSRVVISTYLLDEQTRPRFDENELAGEWNDKLIGETERSGAELQAALAREASKFDRQLSLERKGRDDASDYVHKYTLREELFAGRTTKVRQALQRLMWQEMNGRKE